ncbi:MAG: hypothetical protein ABR600_12150 [Actinomycetota bacterium]
MSQSAKGRNEVEPTDIGRRVSFQWDLPNGLLQEAIGTLELYDHASETYVLRDKSDRLVRVPRRDVRHGKVVS